ncbi:MAG TPA: sialidase family protein [Phycisphaerae bacterium]|nr:sialidase family protein [Phycisphaerae bacterium]
MLTIGLLALLHIAAPPGGVAYREPQLAASRNLVALAFGSGNSIFVSTSKDSGQKFSPPVKVYEGGILPLSRHRGPRVVISRGTIIVTAVVGRTAEQGLHAHGMASDGDLIAWRSTDGGKTWRGGVRINDVPAAAREGLHTLAADGHGKLFSAWLDLRAKGTRLYGAHSNDSGATWSPNILIYASPDGTICQCCHPSAAFAQTGELAVMWRNCLGGSRDLYLAESKDGQHFGTPQKLGHGTWMINACPMDGGGLAFDGNRITTAWRRDQSIYLDEPGSLEEKLGEGKDVAVAAAHGRIHVAWIDNARLETWSSGKVSTLSDGASFPNLAPLPGGEVLAAWEKDGGISLERLP